MSAPYGYKPVPPGFVRYRGWEGSLRIADSKPSMSKVDGKAHPDGDLDALMARSITTTPWGPCTELIRSVVPEEVRDDLRRRAAEFRLTESEMVRFMVLVALYGRDEVKNKFSAVLESIAE